MRTERITRRRGLQILLAFVGNVIPVGLACWADWASHRTAFFVGAAGTCLVPLLVTGLPASWTTIRRVAALAGLVPLTLMQAYTGGAASDYSVLMMMAMVWFGVQGGDADVLLMIAVLAGCSYLPMILVGAPAYPVVWAHATLLVVVGASVAGALRLGVRETNLVTDQLRQAASIDPLTGLLNRRGWQATTTTVLAQARREHRPVAAVVLDLDAFKELNDRFGHEEGDRILRETAERLRSAFRAGDVVARAGGDEFFALLFDTSGEAAVAAVRRLTEKPPHNGAVSAGIAVWDPSEQLTDLLRRADIALYEAKRGGGARTAVAPAPWPAHGAVMTKISGQLPGHPVAANTETPDDSVRR